MLLFILFLVFWVFFFGSAVGSFLNVVAWRLPQKESLFFPASHCPKCGKPIRKRHNLPVLGWLLLRGRCFDCGERISRRYPIVEFVSGLGTLILSWATLVAIVTNAPPETTYNLGAITLLDAFMFWTFLSAALIEMDGFKIPLRLFLPYTVLYLALLFTPYTLFFTGVNSFYGLPEGVVYALLGLPCGTIFFLIARRNDPQNGLALAICTLFALSSWVGVLVLYAITLVAVPMWILLPSRHAPSAKSTQSPKRKESRKNKRKNERKNERSGTHPRAIFWLCCVPLLRMVAWSTLCLVANFLIQSGEIVVSVGDQLPSDAPINERREGGEEEKPRANSAPPHPSSAAVAEQE
ncbi:MAG: prepilin peptidase [Planctomycetia bacterium]|nr:prepilin peptidase [Planctomycetia bacterium]